MRHSTDTSERPRASRWIPAWVRGAGRIALSPRARSDALHEWRRRSRGEPALEPGAVARVLVICHGNICRSPFAGRLLAARSPHLDVRSAGLEAVEGRPAEDAARRIALAFGVDLAGHAAHRMNAGDAAWADLILGMEGHHVAGVLRAWPGGRGKTFLLGDFLAEPPFRIDDPWGREDAFFRTTFARIDEAVARLAARLPGEGS
jgi:protein-tyrosine phosphatase